MMTIRSFNRPRRHCGKNPQQFLNSQNIRCRDLASTVFYSAKTNRLKEVSRRQQPKLDLSESRDQDAGGS